MLILIFYTMIVVYIAYKDSKNRQSLKNFCKFEMDYNISEALKNIDNNYNNTLIQLNNYSIRR